MIIMAKFCIRCGKEYEGETDVCPKCLSESQTIAETKPRSSTSLSLNGSAIFQESMNEPPPQSVEDCTAKDKLTTELWNWANNLEKYGTAVLLLLILGGLISGFFDAKEAAGLTDDDFSAAVFVAAIVKTSVAAIMTYLAFHSIALLVGSLARIVQSSRTTARLAEWHARNHSE